MIFYPSKKFNFSSYKVSDIHVNLLVDSHLSRKTEKRSIRGLDPDRNVYDVLFDVFIPRLPDCSFLVLLRLWGNEIDVYFHLGNVGVHFNYV